MFALEFLRDGKLTDREAVLLNRHQAVIGWKPDAHVLLEELQDLGVELEVTRGKARSFQCQPLEGSSSSYASLLRGIFENTTDLVIGSIGVRVTALDTDLVLRDSETPDRAGVRVLRQAAAFSSPEYPALVVQGESPIVVSFTPEQIVYVGRAEKNSLTIDSPDVSSTHCRIGFESGMFWVEDLGSTNGTFVENQQISGRQNVDPGTGILLGGQTTLIGVVNSSQLSQASSTKGSRRKRVEKKFPILLSCSEVARPARLEIPVGGSVVIGRDPACDMWLGAPHISRRHCLVNLSKTGVVRVEDASTNGISYTSGTLHKGDFLELSKTPEVFSFGGDITLGICFSEEQERAFMETGGSASAFSGVSREQQQPGNFRYDQNLEAREMSMNPNTVIGSMSIGAKLLVIIAAIGFLAVCIVFISLLWSVLQ